MSLFAGMEHQTGPVGTAARRDCCPQVPLPVDAVDRRWPFADGPLQYFRTYIILHPDLSVWHQPLGRLLEPQFSGGAARRQRMGRGRPGAIITRGRN